MPRRIRDYEGIEPARQNLPAQTATPEAFGANIGAAAVQLGQSAQQLGVMIADTRERENRLAAASLNARMTADWELE